MVISKKLDYALLTRLAQIFCLIPSFIHLTSPLFFCLIRSDFTVDVFWKAYHHLK